MDVDGISLCGVGAEVRTRMKNDRKSSIDVLDSLNVQLKVVCFEAHTRCPIKYSLSALSIN